MGRHKPQTHRYIPFLEGALDGARFEWVHLYPGMPVPPLGEGSFNYLLWEILQQHYPDHLLMAKYYPESLSRVRGEKAAAIYLDYQGYVPVRERIRKVLTGIGAYDSQDFAAEACRQIAEIDAPNIMVWGSLGLVHYVRRAFPQRTIAFAQRYFEIPWAPVHYYGYCDYLVTQTHGTARFLFEQQSAVHPTVVCIPNGGDLDVYKPLPDEEKLHLRRKLDLPEDKCIVLFPSKLNPNKGTSYLHEWIRACEDLVPSAFFVVTGPLASPLEGSVRRLVALLRQAPNVRWLEGTPHDEMPSWYQAADVSLMPGVWREGMSMAAVESLATGLPLVATRRGIYPEIVFHDVNGWLCRPENLLGDGLEAIRTLASDAPLRKRLSLGARAYAEKRLDRRRCLDNFRAFFEGRLLDVDADLDT